MGAAAHTSLVLGGIPPLTTEGVLPPIRLVDVQSVGELRVDVLEIVACARDAIARLRTLLVAGTHTTRDLQQYQADIAACAADVRVFRAVLDGWRAADSKFFEDGAILIGLWKWERGTRRLLVQVLADVQASQALAAELAAGRANRVYIVRSGETWQSIAQSELGDWRAWRQLVELNNGDPAVLASGTVLTIPQR